MVTAGICHTDDHFATGDAVPWTELVEMMRAAGMATPDWSPLIGGQWAPASSKKSVPGVSSFSRAITSGCRSSPRWQASWSGGGQSCISDVGAKLFAKEMITDGTVRRHFGEEDLIATAQLGTFSEYVGDCRGFVDRNR